MAGIPVVIATNGRGEPVVHATNAAPATIATNGHGTPIVLVTERGRPMNVEGVYPLDIAAAAVAYGFRRLSSAYAGPLIRVRRSSDNAEQDIGYQANGWLAEGVLAAFAGSDSAYVTTWYDQSGNAKNAAQSTSAAQPRIVNAGVVETIGGKPAVNTVDDTRYFTTLLAQLDQPFSAMAVVKAPNYALGNSKHILRAATGATLFVSSTGQASLNGGSSIAGGSLTNNAAYVLDWVANSTSSRVGINGVTTTGNAGTGALGASVNLLRGTSTTNNYVGLAGELIVFPGALTVMETNHIGKAIGAPRGIAVT